MITWCQDTSIYCCYCGKPFSGTVICTKDHVIPKSKGGSSLPANKRNCCRQCNHEKADLFLEQYLEKVSRGWTSKKKVHIKAENILHLIEYVKIKGEALFRDHGSWLYYKRKYIDILPHSSTVERQPDKLEDVGSIPAVATIRKDLQRGEYKNFY